MAAKLISCGLCAKESNFAEGNQRRLALERTVWYLTQKAVNRRSRTIDLFDVSTFQPMNDMLGDFKPEGF